MWYVILKMLNLNKVKHHIKENAEIDDNFIIKKS